MKTDHAFGLNKIKTKMLLFGLVMSILPFLLVGFLNNLISKGKLWEEVDAANRGFVESAADELDLLFSHTFETMDMINDSLLSADLAEDDLYFFQHSFLKNSPYMEEISLLNANGDEWYKLNRWRLQDLHKQTAIDRQMAEAVRSGRSYIGHAVAGENGQMMVDAAVPRMGMQGMSGGVRVRLNVGELVQQLALKASLEKTARLYVFDESLHPVVGALAPGTPSGSLGGQTVGNNLLLSSLPAHTAKPVSHMFQSPAEETMIGYAMRSRATSWIVMLEQPADKAFATFARLQENLLLSTLLIGLMVSAISIAAAVFFGKKMERIETAVRRVADGDFSVRIPVSSSDELGRLASSCNEMAHSLQVKTNQIIEEKQRLDMVVSGLGMGLILIDESFRVRWANRTISMWFGGSGDLLGQACDQAIGENCSLCRDCPMKTRTMVSQNQKELVSTRVDEHGRTRYFRHQVFPLYPAKEESAFLEVIEDITEKREMEAIVVQADKLAAIGLMASGIAHEINNPLGILSVYGQDLRDRLAEEDIATLAETGELQRYLETMDKQIARCKDITTRLLHFSRKSPTAPERVDVHQAIDDVILLISHKVRDKQVEIVKDLTAAQPFVEATAGELQQILLNLLTNGLYAVGHSGLIHIRTRAKADEILIEIDDNGVGIAAEHLPHVFDPFYTTKPIGKGTGLGLSVCYGIVKRLGGDIKMRSQPGEGTNATVVLPLAKEKEHAS
ncbi:sensor histidine kinase [Brevibacillus borstelensis]|uniref:sensor histidine kinase n=1 Tax=Brevibacillus borstelensis TaxID=45462 RepID=UPI0030C05312